MAARNRSNPLALAVLICLYERPMHPYEVSATLRQRHKHESVRLNYGSLYAVVASLEKRGLIVPLEVERSGRLPERTVYELTDAGRIETHDWLTELLSTPVKDYTAFEAALSFLPALPPDDVVALLRERAQHLEIELAREGGTRELIEKARLPRLFWVEEEFRTVLREAELDYVRRLVARDRGRHARGARVVAGRARGRRIPRVGPGRARRRAGRRPRRRTRRRPHRRPGRGPMTTLLEHTSRTGTIISTDRLRKSFRSRGGPVAAVKGVSIEVRQGEIFGFLGPNGAGKTTTLRMLTTLLPIDEGSATVAGFDVARQPKQVRERIGYVSQLGGADDLATGRENLVLQGRLYGGDLETVTRRAAALMDVLEIAEFADRKVNTYSGGQRRRLDIALGIVHEPEVLFLDEPSTGLDPQNRANLWEHVRGLRERGTTIFLTTHYLEEADALCDRLVIMDHGEIVVEGTPRELKREVSGESVVLDVHDTDGAADRALALLGAEPYVRESSARRQRAPLLRERRQRGAAADPAPARRRAHRHQIDAASPSRRSTTSSCARRAGRCEMRAGPSNEEVA